MTSLLAVQSPNQLEEVLSRPLPPAKRARRNAIKPNSVEAHQLQDFVITYLVDHIAIGVNNNSVTAEEKNDQNNEAFEARLLSATRYVVAPSELKTEDSHKNVEPASEG